MRREKKPLKMGISSHTGVISGKVSGSAGLQSVPTPNHPSLCEKHPMADPTLTTNPPVRFKNGGSWVTPELAARRQQDTKVCERCGVVFHRKGYQIPALWRSQRFCTRLCSRQPRVPLTRERFESFVMPEPMSGCWLWTETITKQADGNPRAVIWDRPRRRIAARVAWELYRGPIPATLEVCHTCDNGYCVNPDHLWLGTHQQNMADMVRKGRRPVTLGSAHQRAILTEAQVRAIRSDRRVARLVAPDFGVSTSTVAAIRSGQNWSHLK